MLLTTEQNIVTENKDPETETVIVGVKHESTKEVGANIKVKAHASKSVTNKKNRLFVHPFKKLKTGSQLSDHPQAQKNSCSKSRNSTGQVETSGNESFFRP